MAVFPFPVLVTVRVPSQIVGQKLIGPVRPFLMVSKEVKGTVGKWLGIEPEGVCYQVLQVVGDQTVIVEVTKINPVRRIMEDGSIDFMTGDLLDVLEPVVADAFSNGTRIEVFAETFKDDIDVRTHASRTVDRNSSASRFR